MGLRFRGVVLAVLVLVAPAAGWAPATAQTAPVMTSAPPPPGVMGNAYLHQFTAGPLELVFTVVSGTLVPGLVLTPQGFLTGVPAAAGTFGPATVCATNVLFPPACQDVTIVVVKRQAGILLAPSAGGPIGTPLRATATLVGALLPTGTMTFRLFADPGCTVEVFSSEVPVTLYGGVTSADYQPIVRDAYRWTSSYTGDANHEPVSTSCAAANPVVITPPGGPATTTTSTTTTTTTSTSTTTTTSTTVAPTTTTTSTTVPAPSGSRYVPLSPVRVDAAPAVQVGGHGGVPAEATAAVLNVTVTDPTAWGYLTLYPDGTPPPLAASVTFRPGETVSSLLVVKLGAGGRVATFNSGGATDLAYDVAGYFVDGPGPAGRYQPVAPVRIADTRLGLGGVRLGAGESLDLQLPGEGLGAAVLNVVATGATAPSALTVHPAGEPRPATPNLSFGAGETASNPAMVKVAADRKVTVHNQDGETDVIVDLSGTYTDASVAGTLGGFNPLAPARLLDTRSGPPVPAGGSVEVPVAGVAGVPATGVRAVVLSVTVIQPAEAGYLTASPPGAAPPAVSHLNYGAGEVRTNLVVAEVGAGGQVALFTAGETQAVVDVAGWFS